MAKLPSAINYSEAELRAAIKAAQARGDMWQKARLDLLLKDVQDSTTNGSLAKMLAKGLNVKL